jgi:outer membrane protein
MTNGKKIGSNKGNKPCNVFIAFVVSALCVFSALFAPVLAHADDAISVGVVRVTFLMEKAPQAELASALLKEKFLPQEENLARAMDEITTLESELEKLAVTNPDKDLKRQKEREIRAKKRTRSRLLQDFREELRYARDTALDEVQ